MDVWIFRCYFHNEVKKKSANRDFNFEMLYLQNAWAELTQIFFVDQLVS